MRTWGGYTLNGKRHYTESTAETLQKVFSEFVSLDNDFVWKLRQRRPKWFNNRRQFIADAPKSLYTSNARYNRVYVNSCSRQLSNGQYIGTHMGFVEAEKRIKVGCEIAGLEYDVDLILHEQ